MATWQRFAQRVKLQSKHQLQQIEACKHSAFGIRLHGLGEVHNTRTVHPWLFSALHHSRLATLEAWLALKNHPYGGQENRIKTIRIEPPIHTVYRSTKCPLHAGVEWWQKGQIYCCISHRDVVYSILHCSNGQKFTGRMLTALSKYRTNARVRFGMGMENLCIYM